MKIEIKNDILEIRFYAKGVHSFEEFWDALPQHKGHKKENTYDKRTFETGLFRVVNGMLKPAKQQGKGAFYATMIYEF